MNGIFCVEGQWHRNLTERGSVLPILELLEQCGRARFIHRDVATSQELGYFLSRWTEPRYSRFRVGYFAMHGGSKQLYVTDKEAVELDVVAETLQGRCDNKRLYFGSCSVLKASDAVLTDFLYTTGASLLCGYTKAVDWVESAAFETVLLDYLTNGERVDAVERAMRSSRWAPLASHLGFKIVYSNGRVA